MGTSSGLVERAVNCAVGPDAGIRPFDEWDRLPGLVRQAVEAGVLNAATALNGGISVHDESRTHPVHRLDIDGTPVAYAKSRGWAAATDGDDSLAAERRALTLLRRSGLVPMELVPMELVPMELVPMELAPTQPESHYVDVLWTQALQPCEPIYRVISSSSPARVITAVRAWGQALARLHRSPAEPDVTPTAALPWVLAAGDGPAHLRAMVPRSAALTVWAMLREDRAVRAALQGAHEAWSATHWTHGDATSANCLARVTKPYQWRIWFVDLETAGLGDPGWDLATAYESLEFHAISRRIDVRPVLTSLLSGYRDAGGPARLTRNLLVARAALTAVQVASSARTASAQQTVGPFLRRVAALTDGQFSPILSVPLPRPVAAKPHPVLCRPALPVPVRAAELGLPA
ncbi:MAG TPA: phosphotransferase [Jatrophihabitans sp.]|jgi:hypothetical protein